MITATVPSIGEHALAVLRDQQPRLLIANPEAAERFRAQKAVETRMNGLLRPLQDDFTFVEEPRCYVLRYEDALFGTLWFIYYPSEGERGRLTVARDRTLCGHSWESGDITSLVELARSLVRSSEAVCAECGG